MMRGEHSGFELMQKLYEEFKDTGMDFCQDFREYAYNGYIRMSPTAMALARPCRDEEGDYWFIRAAVGPLPEVMAMLPGYLPRIAWCRNNDGIIRMYKTDRLFRLAIKQLEKEREKHVSETLSAN